METRRRRRGCQLALALLVVIFPGCALDDGGVVPAPDGLGPGSRGPEVRALHEYLVRFGYFENPALRRSDPEWRPIVGELPDDPALFDRPMQKAVTAYQRLNGLEQTGVVDAATRARMAEPRCGHADTDPEQVDPSRKFALFGPAGRSTPSAIAS